MLTMGPLWSGTEGSGGRGPWPPTDEVSESIPPKSFQITTPIVATITLEECIAS